MKDEIVLETKGLTKSFSGFMALMDLDLILYRGEIKSVIGPNGAGKSTLFNIITGMFAPIRGRVIFEGEDITGWSAHKIALKGIAKSFQITNIFSGLSVYENIRLSFQAKQKRHSLFGKISSMKKVEEKSVELLTKLHLLDRHHKLAGNLSHGEQRFLEIGIALASEPKLLLLDEPTAGMTPAETKEITSFIKKISKDHTTLLIEHDMDVVMEISDTVTVLNQGKKLTEGPPDMVKQNEEVNAIYFGGES